MANNYDILEKLTQGTDNFEEVDVTVDDENIPVSLRPLNSGELNELRKIEKKPFTMKMNLNANGKRQDVKKESSKLKGNRSLTDDTK